MSHLRTLSLPCWLHSRESISSCKCSLASNTVHLIDDLSNVLLVKTSTTRALSVSNTVGPGHHCEARRNPSAQACASASFAEAQRKNTRHATDVPYDHSDSCSTKETIDIDLCSALWWRFPACAFQLIHSWNWDLHQPLAPVVGLAAMTRERSVGRKQNQR
jgi:hypothetical protein